MANKFLVIQGGNATSAKVTQAEVSKTVEFCMQAFKPAAQEQRDAVMEKVEKISGSKSVLAAEHDEELQKALSPDELQILNTIRARQMVRQEDIVNIENFNNDAIDGLVPNMKTGALGLIKAPDAADIKPRTDNVLALMKGEEHLTQTAIAAH